MSDLGAEILEHGNQQNIDVMKYTVDTVVCLTLSEVCVGERVRKPFVE